jgi:membrane dipeptidase
MVDVSHPSKGSMMQAIGLSKAPVIASHSGVRKLANVSRNMDDEMLMAMKTNGGVIQMVALSGYVKSDPPERGPALTALRQEFGLGGGRGGAGGGARGAGAGRGAAAPVTPPCSVEGAAPVATGRGGRGGATAGIETLAPDRRAEFERRLADIDRKWPSVGRATVKDFVDEIDYAVKLIGIDHVGISSDFDGGGGIDGWNSAAETFNVTLELVRRGYTEEQIGKIWSGNLLRVWGDVERVAKEIQAGRR